MHQVAELGSCTLSVIMEKLTGGIMEIIENTVHVHNFLSFVLISWANRYFQ